MRDVVGAAVGTPPNPPLRLWRLQLLQRAADLQPTGNFPVGSREGAGRVRDVVGAAVGMSGRTYERAKAVVDAAESGDLEAVADETGGTPGKFSRGSSQGRWARAVAVAVRRSSIVAKRRRDPYRPGDRATASVAGLNNRLGLRASVVRRSGNP